MSEPSFKERAARALNMSDRGHDDDWKLYAEDVDIVLKAIAETLAAGKAVHVPGVGTLKTKLRRRRLNRPGPDRGKGIEERVATLAGGTVIPAGEPYDL